MQNYVWLTNATEVENTIILNYYRYIVTFDKCQIAIANSIIIAQSSCA